MKLLLVTTREDRSRDRVAEEAKRKGLEVSFRYYEDLDGRDLRPEDFQGFDFSILRDPYNTGVDLSSIMKKILNFLRKDRVLDYRVYEKYPDYEDKLFQHELFGKLMEMPKYWHFNNAEEVDIESFPAIVKKRVSSRGRGIYLINSREEMERFLKENDIDKYFIEEYLNIRKDVRVLLIGHEIVGAAERKFRIKDNLGYQGVGVKVIDRFEVPEDTARKIVEVSKAMGSEFCGIDFIIDDKGRAILLECNVSPQFVSFERVSGVNAAEKLMDYIIELCGGA
jgi:D-alanine-D-alanine ligase-like ATP-grasp enzyme